MQADELRERFRGLHASGTFVMPNPWDIGSARILASLGFEAIATTSSGHAASLGRLDQHVTRDELVAHVAALAPSVAIPLNVDAESGFADDPGGIAQTVRLLADAGAAGMSIEDYDPVADAILDLDEAVERVLVAVEAARRTGLVLTARAENHLHGRADLDDTIARLRAYREAGADVVYAPGLVDAADISTVVASVDAPLNVLALPPGPSVPELAGIGVRRISTGGSLARAAYGALAEAARELAGPGTSTYLERALAPSTRDVAFSER